MTTRQGKHINLFKREKTHETYSDGRWTATSNSMGANERISEYLQNTN
jgi:hypothetical protein